MKWRKYERSFFSERRLEPLPLVGNYIFGRYRFLFRQLAVNVAIPMFSYKVRTQLLPASIYVYVLNYLFLRSHSLCFWLYPLLMLHPKRSHTYVTSSSPQSVLHFHLESFVNALTNCQREFALIFSQFYTNFIIGGKTRRETNFTVILYIAPHSSWRIT